MAYTKIGRIRFNMRGAQNSNTDYGVMDVVQNSAGTIAYMAVKNVPAGTALTNTSYWKTLVDVTSLKGDTGATGAQGIQGVQGERGEKGDKGDKGDTGNTGIGIESASVDSSGHLQIELSNDTTVDAGQVIGAKGDKGDTGADGEDGASIVNAVVQTNGTLTLVRSDNQNINVAGSIIGPKGDKGDKGDQGQGITILGSYDSESALIAAHPTGSAGDAYLVGGSLYVWSATESEWVNVGSIKGEKGDKGDTGDAPNAVLYTEQTLTDAQKTQARNNIGVTMLVTSIKLGTSQTAYPDDYGTVDISEHIPKITYSTTDLTAGTSALASGEVYLVYE